VPAAPLDPIPIYNDSGEDCPPGGVCEPTGELTDDGALKVRKPTVTGGRSVVINDRQTLPAGGYGQGFFSPRVVVAYDAEDLSPTPGVEYGAVSGSWRLGRNAGGFLFLGVATGGLFNAVRFGGASSSGSGSGSGGGPSLDLVIQVCPVFGTYTGGA